MHIDPNEPLETPEEPCDIHAPLDDDGMGSASLIPEDQAIPDLLPAELGHDGVAEDHAKYDYEPPEIEDVDLGSSTS